MPKKTTTRPTRTVETPAARAPADVRTVLESLERLGDRRTRDGMPRYGIVVRKAFGVPMARIQKLGKELGRDHDLAAALWASGWYDARLLAAFVDDPSLVTPAQMDRWCRDFDNWGVCDTVCFKLFDQTPHAYEKVRRWSARRDEFVKRAAFALLASLALHDKRAGDEAFVACLPLIEAAAADDRNFVKKGVSWALRSVGRRNAALRQRSLDLARRLAASANPAARWIGRDAARELERRR